jgi:hypothetical protein
MYSPPQTQSSFRPTVRLPPVVWLAILGLGLAFVVVLAPALLASRIRRWFPSPMNWVAAGAFAFVCFVAAVAIGGPAYVSVDERWYSDDLLGGLGIYVAPVLFIWAASAFAWVELGWVGTLVGLFFAGIWALKLIVFTPPHGSDFWPDMNCMSYGAAIAMAVVAPALIYLGRKIPPPQPAAPMMPQPPYAPPYGAAYGAPPQQPPYGYGYPPPQGWDPRYPPR